LFPDAVPFYWLLLDTKEQRLEDLFHETLKDIYFAENKILKTLPKMAKAAQSKELKAAFGLARTRNPGSGEAARPRL
jgi:hypothetical protein